MAAAVRWFPSPGRVNDLRATSACSKPFPVHREHTPARRHRAGRTSGTAGCSGAAPLAASRSESSRSCGAPAGPTAIARRNRRPPAVGVKIGKPAIERMLRRNPGPRRQHTRTSQRFAHPKRASSPPNLQDTGISSASSADFFSGGPTGRTRASTVMATGGLFLIDAALEASRETSVTVKMMPTTSI